MWYWARRSEPTLLTAAESDQSNNLMHPPFAICLWPVSMVPSLTPPQLQKHHYPSGWNQDDPYHGNLDASSPTSGWVRSACVDSLLLWRPHRSKKRKKPCLSRNHQQILKPFCTSSHSYSLRWLTAMQNTSQCLDSNWNNIMSKDCSCPDCPVLSLKDPLWMSEIKWFAIIRTGRSKKLVQ